MAVRPVYIPKMTSPFFTRMDTEFQYYNGFALSQKRKCIHSLHDSFRTLHNDANMLEVSTSSEVKLGVELSAFNLSITLEDGNKTTLESLFQGSKIFENGGPYTDLWLKSSYDAKKDTRLRSSGNIVGFIYNNEPFPKDPKTYFYDWIYICALNQDEVYKNEIVKYDAFTDISFNPSKSLNCQAEAVAMFVGLSRSGLLEEALKSKEDFKRVVFSSTISHA